MTAELPPELAPSLRAAAEKLLAEVGEAAPRRHGYDRPPARKLCWRCHKPGPLVLHRRVHGDDSSVVEVHAGCHRQLHDKRGHAARQEG